MLHKREWQELVLPAVHSGRYGTPRPTQSPWDNAVVAGGDLAATVNRLKELRPGVAEVRGLNGGIGADGGGLAFG